MEKVKYYGKNDLSIACYVERIYDVLNMFDDCDTDNDVNDIIELWNIIQFSEQGKIDQRWNADFTEKYRCASTFVEPTIGRFIGNINSGNISAIAKNVERQYMIEKYNVDKKVIYEDLVVFFKNYRCLGIIYNILVDLEFPKVITDAA